MPLPGYPSSCSPGITHVALHNHHIIHILVVYVVIQYICRVLSQGYPTFPFENKDGVPQPGPSAHELHQGASMELLEKLSSPAEEKPSRDFWGQVFQDVPGWKLVNG